MTTQARKIFNMVLAIVVAAGAWAFVVINYKPMTEVSYSEVPISYTGLVTLANRGYAVSGANHDTIQVRLQQKRVDTGRISADDILVTADVSGLSTGENTVALELTPPEGTIVVDASYRNVTLNIESATSEEMEISVEYPEGADEDAEPIITDMSVTSASVIATEDKLEEIDRVAAVLDPESLGSKARHFTIELAALDKEGNRVHNVFIDPENVSLRAAAGYVRTVRLDVPVKDDSDDSYERRTIAPESITIKGSKEVVDEIASIKTVETDITYVYEDSEIPLEYELPEGIYLANEQDMQKLAVKVTEKKTEEDE